MTIANTIIQALSSMTEDHFKKGDKVIVNNAKSYDATCKTDTVSGKVIGSTGKGDKEVYMIQVGNGQMNVSHADLKIEESVDESALRNMKYKDGVLLDALDGGGEAIIELFGVLRDSIDAMVKPPQGAEAFPEFRKGPATDLKKEFDKMTPAVAKFKSELNKLDY